MRNMHPLYREVNDWIIIDAKTIHDFTYNENPIEIVQVLIGKLVYENIGINHKYETFRTPITRWITRKQFEYLKENSNIRR